MSIKIVKNGTQWTIREGYERIQDSFGLDDLRKGLNGKTYKLIKENNVRSVIQYLIRTSMKMEYILNISRERVFLITSSIC